MDVAQDSPRRNEPGSKRDARMMGGASAAHPTWLIMVVAAAGVIAVFVYALHSSHTARTRRRLFARRAPP